MSKVFKTAMKIAPIALQFVPGVGTALGAALGATGASAGILGSSILGAGAGALSGGGLKGALLGGATGGLGAGGATKLLGAAGTGLTGAGLKAASGALTGAAAGAYTGGNLKSALLGGLTGGGLGYAQAGGFGTAAGETLKGGLQGPTQGSGILGSATRGISNLTGGYAGGNLAGSGGSMFSSGSKLSNLLSSVGTGLAQSKAEEDMLKAQRAAQAQLSPYAQSGQAANARLSELLGVGGNAQAQGYGSLNKQFNAADLQNDAGYQFRLGEGLKAQQRALGAQGGLFSGAALKAAQEYGQGLADQTFNDAYNRDLQSKQTTYNQLSGLTGTGQSAAGGIANILGTQGDIKANAGLARANLLNSTFSNILSGAGRKIVGYNPDGTPVYEDSIYG